MVRFWCPWCGSEERSAHADDLIACCRCLKEFSRLFGFMPVAWMEPLPDGVEPGEPAAARKRFTFYDARSGRVIGRTEPPHREAEPRAG